MSIEFGGVGPPVADGRAQIGEGDGERRGFGACRLLVDGAGELGQRRFELGEPLGERGELGPRPPVAGPSSASAKRAELGLELGDLASIWSMAEALAMSAWRAPRRSWRPAAARPRRSAGAIAAASATEPPSLGGLGQSLERGFELGDAVGQLGELGRGLACRSAQAPPCAFELRQRFGIGRRARRRSSLARRCSSAARSGRRLARLCRIEAAPGKGQSERRRPGRRAGPRRDG